MTYKKFAGRLAKRSGISRDRALEILLHLRDEVASTLASEGAVKIPGVGTLYTAVKPARRAWNPQTRTHMTVPRLPTVRYRVSPVLVEKVSDLRSSDPSQRGTLSDPAKSGGAETTNDRAPEEHKADSD